MRVYDELHNPVGILDDNTHQLSVISGNSESFIKNENETRRQKNGEYFWAKEITDWFFASGVLAIVGSLLYFLLSAEPEAADEELFFFLVPSRLFLLPPLAFFVRFFAVTLLYRLNTKLAPMILLYIFGMVTALIMAQTDYEGFLSFGGLVLLGMEIWILRLFRKNMRNYLIEVGIAKSRDTQNNDKPDNKTGWQELSPGLRTLYTCAFLVMFLSFINAVFEDTGLRRMDFSALSPESTAVNCFIVAMLLVFRILETLQFVLLSRKILKAF